MWVKFFWKFILLLIVIGFYTVDSDCHDAIERILKEIILKE